MKHYLRSFFLMVVVFFAYGYESANAYDESYVHRHLNAKAVETSNLDAYMRGQLGFGEGIETKFQGLSLVFLVEEGGTREDDFPCYFYHFHDPLKPWDEAGLKNGILGESSVIWAQKGYDVDRTWQDARRLYSQALTSGNEAEWALMFTSLGRLMHLVADLAVPAHVRDDAHPRPEAYETWAKYQDVKGLLNFESLSVSTDIFSHAVQNGMIPITALWDQDFYDGTNPSEDIHGLAEYTNAYFFSSDTIFETSEYPHPNIEDTNYFSLDWKNPETVVREDGNVDRKVYLRNIRAAVPHRLAVAGYFTEDCSAGTPCWQYPFVLDGEVYKDYASKLLPRAVGYSAALLNYFFRGQLEITAPPEFVYSIIDGLDAAQGFRFIKARVRNATAGEEATNDAGQPGQLVAVAQYRLRTNYQADLSADPPTMDSRDEYYSYSVSAPLQVESLTSASPGLECTFDFTANPIPPGITDLYLKVVYKGKLGAEQDAVAVGMKDLCEPQHLSYWNSTDYFLLNGELRKAEEIENDPNVEDYDFFRPVSISEELGFSGSAPGAGTPMVVSVQDMPPARYFRVILLTDVPGGYYVRDHLVSKPYPPGWPYPDDFTVDNGLWTYDMPSVVYQELDGPLWKDTPVYQYRGIIQHQMSYFIRYYPYYIYNADQFPAPPENAEGPYPVTINFP
ncbi:hypothetical protein [Syntrophobacter fumaroxidans]|uniref:Phospholipase C n=1 Tax=Syntrophobacter fumaroxidans (strain DSM 10017 / MPOB) TaxID=335543 RepID=A0LKT7_SYNFM|nr:hypothetical protein [Syntrophobacter fumaroxidans]ABK18039.1 hypothetical protein Sfum_2358 [Syntrophobacter fumaroxidans MPOB]